MLETITHERTRGDEADTGVMLRFMDIALRGAGVHGVNCVTVAVGDVVLEYVPCVGDIVELVAQPVLTGNTSPRSRHRDGRSATASTAAMCARAHHVRDDAHEEAPGAVPGSSPRARSALGDGHGAAAEAIVALERPTPRAAAGAGAAADAACSR